jgi:diamine N-acetyltransferase
MILYGEKVRLCLAMPSDAPLVLQWENDPQFWPITEQAGPFDLQQIEESLQHSGSLEEHGQSRYIIFNQPLEPIGLLDLFNYDAIEKKVGIGVLIGHDRHRGKGYASDAIRTLLQRVRQLNQIKTLDCLIHVDNLNSLTLFTHLGFEIIGSTSFKNRKAHMLQYSL